MSSNLKRTRGISHKKKKTLAATIKIENVVIAKKARLLNRTSRPSPSSSNSVIIDINEENTNECTVTATSVVVINSPPSRRKKSDRYYKVTSHRLNLSFWTTSKTDDDYTNMLPHISKDINGNFNLVYKPRSTSQ